MWIPTAASARPRSRCPASSGWRNPARHGPIPHPRRGSGRPTTAEIPRHVQNGCRLPSQRRAWWCGPSRLPAPRNTQNGCTCRGPWPHRGLAPLDPPRSRPAAKAHQRPSYAPSLMVIVPLVGLHSVVALPHGKLPDRRGQRGVVRCGGSCHSTWATGACRFTAVPRIMRRWNHVEALPSEFKARI
jgi:hypothetical protein